MDKTNITGPSILLVDDNPQNLQVLGNLLHEKKYKIEFALNGESALAWLKKRQFDLILLDLNMPGMNGFEVCKILRSDNTMDAIPIIFLSAESERESILKGFEVGAQDYVTKPFDNRELLARVKTQLDLKSKTENLERINQWLGKKIDNWLKGSIGKQRSEVTRDLSTEIIEFDKDQSFILKDICIELTASMNDAGRLIEKLGDSDNKVSLEKNLKRISESIQKLQKL